MHDFLKINLFYALGALAMDALIGDPEGFPHPVIFIGRQIRVLEKHLRGRANPRRWAVVLGLVPVLSAMAVTALSLFVAHMNSLLYLLWRLLLSCTCLSMHCLAKEGNGVRRALCQSLEAGRKQVSRIVGRDTQALNEQEVILATVETIAENTTDGVISPFLCLLLGGPVLAMGFKAVSTLDSMVGYRDERYRDLGWFSARMDDFANYVPARLAGPCMAMAAFLCRLNGLDAFRILLRDRRCHLSPNCAYTEAPMAGALEIQMGGTHTYFGKTVEKPTIGDPIRIPVPEDITRANHLMIMTCILFAGLCSLIWWVLL